MGEGIVYQLLFDRKLVASQLCLQRGTMLIVLKMTYDEDFKDFSPGFWLRQEMLRSLFAEEKIKTVEAYGRVREGWTKKWTDEVRTMYHFNFYRYLWIANIRRFLKREHQSELESQHYEDRNSTSGPGEGSFAHH